MKKIKYYTVLFLLTCNVQVIGAENYEGEPASIKAKESQLVEAKLRTETTRVFTHDEAMAIILQARQDKARILRNLENCRELLAERERLTKGIISNLSQPKD